MIGRRLKLARSAAGLSLDGLREVVGSHVTARTIGKYERNEAMPGSDDLFALASALGVPLDYLLGDREMTLVDIDFRKKRMARKRDRDRVEVEVLQLMERYLLIESLLHLPNAGSDKLHEDPYSVHRSLDEAERAAADLRNHWELGGDPIPNLVELLEDKGIKVFAVNLTNIDGLTARVRLRHGSAPPVIVINKAAPGERQRFTLSHELGHLVMEVTEPVNAEQAANRFAGAFLMPAEVLRGEIGEHRTSISIAELACLKARFGASVQAIAYRCKDLGIFDEALFRRLFAEFSRLGWRSPPYDEPGRLALEVPTRFKRLVFRALSEEIISDAKAAELLDVTLYNLDTVMDMNEIGKAGNE